MNLICGFVKPRNHVLINKNKNKVNYLKPKVKKCFPNFKIVELPPTSNSYSLKNKIESSSCKNIENKLHSNVKPVTKNQQFRENDFNIQMLSETLYRQIFGGEIRPQCDKSVIKESVEKLKELGLWKEKINYIQDVDLSLPPLKGKNIEEHFWIIGEEQSKPYRELVALFIKCALPNPPQVWLCQKGWTKYVEGEKPVSVPFPEDDAFVFDVEVNVKSGETPTLATAVSPNAWYGWVCQDLAEGVDKIPVNYNSINNLIPFEGKTLNKKRPRIIIGHYVSYDRARIKEQYYLENSALRFLDTISLHICIGAVSKNKFISNKLKNTSMGNKISFSSLKDLYSFYCQKELSKEERNIFLEGLISDVRKDFQVLMTYCSNDVKATFEILQKIFPVFLERFPHPVTLAGMLEMGSPYLTVNSNWNKFLSEADQTYDELKSELSSIYKHKCEKACNLFHNQKFKKDLWMWTEDWSTQELKLVKNSSLKLPAKKSEIAASCLSESKQEIKEEEEEEEDEVEKNLKLKFQYLFDLKNRLPQKLPFMPGYPSWYRKLCKNNNSLGCVGTPQLTNGMIITPRILKMTWENFPLHYIAKYGWGILVADIFAKEVETSIPFETLKDLTIKTLNIDINNIERKKEPHHFYYTGGGLWCNHIIDNCCFFFKIPHQDGDEQVMKYPFAATSEDFLNCNLLNSEDSDIAKIFNLNQQITYWRNNRQRISTQMVVWLNKNEGCPKFKQKNNEAVGVILPQVVVCGTLTRRAKESTWLTATNSIQNKLGSEILSMIQAPPGYHFVGADVDSQELWIASLIGDSYFAKEHGSTPFGWMTLSGTKSSETDMHSITAKTNKISRKEAKVINYAIIYGAGPGFVKKYLKKNHPSMSNAEAEKIALQLFNFTKGKKEYNLISKYSHFNTNITTRVQAERFARAMNQKLEEVFEKPKWKGGIESHAFNRLESIATSLKPETPFLRCRLSLAVEPKFEGDVTHLKTIVNWVVQSGAVDFLHLMLVCMRWLTNGRARYCFSFHDDVRYLLPSEERYNGALAMHITNLLVRCFCTHRLGIYDLPQSVAFFSSVEIDKTLRKDANDDCVSPSNPHGLKKGYNIEPGVSLNIYETIEKSGGSLAPFRTEKKKEMSQSTKRKHVHMEVLQGELVIPNKNQQIVKIVESKGNNLHEVETSESIKFLVSMPNKFRKNVWVRRGNYVIVESIAEGGKVKAEIVNILTSDYIKFLKKENAWPVEFSTKTEQEASSDNET